jgi:hypothetical protein
VRSIKKTRKRLTSKLESKTLFPFLYKAKRETGKSNAKRRELFTHCLLYTAFCLLAFLTHPLKGIQPFELEKKILLLLLHLPRYTIFFIFLYICFFQEMRKTPKIFHHMKIFHLLA